MIKCAYPERPFVGTVTPDGVRWLTQRGVDLHPHEHARRQGEVEASFDRLEGIKAELKPYTHVYDVGWRKDGPYWRYDRVYGVMDAD